MVSQQRGGDFINPETERPRSLQSSWFELARSVYSWTDRRESAVDKARWRKQPPGFHMEEPAAPDKAGVEAVASPANATSAPRPHPLIVAAALFEGMKSLLDQAHRLTRWLASDYFATRTREEMWFATTALTTQNDNSSFHLHDPMLLFDHAVDLDNGGISMKTRILDRSFKYVPSHQTNIRRTFARARRALSQQQAKAPIGQRIEVATMRPEQ